MIIEIVRQPDTNTIESSDIFTSDSSPLDLNQSSDIFRNLGNRSRKLTHLSSPAFDEKLILPLSTRKKNTKSNRTTKKVYKVLRKPKSYKKSYK